MAADIYYLPFGGHDDEDDALRARNLRFDYHDDRENVQKDDFRALYQFVGHDPEATLDNVYPRWNAGSGYEAAAFMVRECCDPDCDLSWDFREGNPNDARRDLEKHEEDTGHTVEEGTRSLSVGDVVVVDGEAHLVAPIGFTRQEHLDDLAHADARDREASAAMYEGEEAA